jgi:Uma2 family endonuclease
MARALESVAQRLFTVEEYHRMAEAGILGPDERVELVRGVIREMSPKDWAHVTATRAVFLTLENALRGRASVYFEAPLIADPIDSEPEPDVLVCSNPDEWAYRSPRTKPLLVIEVADSSLDYDLGEKAALYAEAGVPEYWVVNLIDRVVVLFREPSNGTYLHSLSCDEHANIRSGVWPDVVIEVSAFFPPAGSGRFEEAP